MDFNELADELERLVHTPGIEEIAQDRTQDLGTRIAALLWWIACADHAASHAATEIICELQEPEAELDLGDPLMTPIGRRIAEAAGLSKEEAEARLAEREGLCIPSQIVLRAEADEVEPNPDLDHILRRTTGRDLKWWVNWMIRQRR